MQSERWRGRMLETSLLVMEFLMKKSGREFRPGELAQHVGFTRRSAYRWIGALEGMGWVETEPAGPCFNGHERLKYRSTFTAERMWRR